MERRRFDARRRHRRLARRASRTPCAASRRQDGVALIDLTAMSQRFYEALGPDAVDAGVRALPGRHLPGPDGGTEGRHALQRVRRVRAGARRGRGHQGRPASAWPRASRRTSSPFDPAHPDSPDAWSLPASLSARAGQRDRARRCRPSPPARRSCSSATRPCRTPRPGQLGWGTAIAHYFDASKIRVVNRALGGRSSRTFQTEGLWDQALKEMNARRLRADPVRPQRRRLAQHRPRARLAPGHGRRDEGRRDGGHGPHRDGAHASAGTCASTSPTRRRKA